VNVVPDAAVAGTPWKAYSTPVTSICAAAEAAGDVAGDATSLGLAEAADGEAAEDVAGPAGEVEGVEPTWLHPTVSSVTAARAAIRRIGKPRSGWRDLRRLGLAAAERPGGHGLRRDRSVAANTRSARERRTGRKPAATPSHRREHLASSWRASHVAVA
jgi:hypothetical protein